MSKYKVGDKVRILHGGYSGVSGLEDGDVFAVVDFDCHFVFGDGGRHGNLRFSFDEVEPYTAPTLDLATVEINISEANAAMKEFAGHAERAAAALERIKEALK